MKERPILFSGSMVRAILEGRKTQTRRVMKCQSGAGLAFQKCPYGASGDRLWVREAWSGATSENLAFNPKHPLDELSYRADWDPAPEGSRWRPSIHMPRWASRLTLEIVSVRVERLQDIGEADAKAEGVSGKDGLLGVDKVATYKRAFSNLWESINGPSSWALNPWVWVVEFRKEIAA